MKNWLSKMTKKQESQEIHESFYTALHKIEAGSKLNAIGARIPSKAADRNHVIQFQPSSTQKV